MQPGTTQPAIEPHQILEASPNAIIGVDANANITYANARVADAFGYSPEELVGLPLETLLPERSRERHVGRRARFMDDAIPRPMGVGMDLAARRKDGQEFPVEVSLSPVQTPDGLQVFATVVDITARKGAEANLLQSQKLESIGRLAGGVAHDFNNILFAINGYTELLIEDLADQPPDDLAEVRHSLGAIQEAADRGADLTRQLLAFSSQQVVTRTVVDPGSGVRALEPMLRRLIGENVGLRVVTDAPTGRVRIDVGQLDQIVMNLVVNARDAMPDGGSVTIEVGMAQFEAAYTRDHVEVEPGSYVMVAVSDTGHGMDRETREHIFEPFFTTKGPGRGTGLGLPTIYGIVRQSGGHIWVYSEPGHGSTFKLYFPSVADPATPPPPPPRADPRGGTGTILLVEDEPAVRDMTRRILERAGYSVIQANNGRVAMEKLESLDAGVDVLLTDVVMPYVSGLELADWVLDRYPETGVVLMSGYTAETLDLERLLARGALFVTKPVASGDMLRAIAKARRRDAVGSRS